MHRTRTRFTGLYWRLTGSYVLVTVLAAVIVQIAVTLSSSVQDYQNLQVRPVSSSEGGVNGPLSPAPSGFARFLSIFGNHFQAYGLAFILLASVIGTLTGLLITRNVTRRLRRITQAADAWSQGEFAVEVRDPTRDEIGQLGQDLNGMAEQLHNLLATREELAVVEERNRLARELHDTVKQQVFANALLVRAARTVLDRDPDQARAHLVDAEALASRTQDELIALIRALRPAALADHGLAAELRAYGAEWSGRMGIAQSLAVSGERATPLETEEALLRVAQEALANVARHSGACNVALGLFWGDETLTLSVRDDGCGFDVARAAGRGSGGVGLASMCERVEALGGAFDVASGPEGTTLTARVPLPPPASPPAPPNEAEETQEARHV